MADLVSTKIPVDDEAAATLCAALKIEGFFLEFTALQVKGVFPNSTYELYPTGFRLMTTGDKGRDLFVIHTGKVSVLRPFVMQDIYLGAGDLFGEMGLVRDGVRTATVVAAEPSKIFRLLFQDLQYLMANNPALGEHLNSVAYHRL